MHLELIGTDSNGIINWRFKALKERKHRDDFFEGLPFALRERIHTLVFSDFHLGSPAAKAHAAMAVFNTFWFEQFILNGDVFDESDFSRLKSSHYHLLGHIRTLTRPDRELKEVWVEGNHDIGIANVMKYVVGIPVREHFDFEFNGIKYFVIHGHQFDSVVGGSPLLTKFLVRFTRPAWLVDPENRHVGLWVRRKLRAWRREADRVCIGAVRRAVEVGASVVICGHVHHPEIRKIDGVTYVNGGSFCENPSSFVTISDSGCHLNMVHIE